MPHSEEVGGGCWARAAGIWKGLELGLFPITSCSSSPEGPWNLGAVKEEAQDTLGQSSLI